MRRPILAAVALSLAACSGATAGPLGSQSPDAVEQPDTGAPSGQDASPSRADAGTPAEMRDASSVAKDASVAPDSSTPPELDSGAAALDTYVPPPIDSGSPPPAQDASDPTDAPAWSCTPATPWVTVCSTPDGGASMGHTYSCTGVVPQGLIEIDGSVYYGHTGNCFF